MKKILFILCALVAFAGYSQAPQSLSYQSVIRDSEDNLITNQMIGIQISIIEIGAGGAIAYVERQTPTTNANGLMTIEVGTGNIQAGVFAVINWAGANYEIKSEVDITGGSNYTITGTSQLLSVPYALHAKTAESVLGQTGYQVGDFADGGIVFWVDETGEHGLVCAKTDQFVGIRWYEGVSANTRAKGDGPFSGKANTTIIIAVQAALGGDSLSSAARVCNEVQITENGKTYGDWYLPSVNELQIMYLNKAIINAKAVEQGGSTFFNDKYWSSTEQNTLNARDYDFNTGTPFYSNKYLLRRVRAVRSF